MQDCLLVWFLILVLVSRLVRHDLLAVHSLLPVEELMLLIAKAFIKCLHWSQSLTNSFFPVWQALSDRFSGEIPDDQMAHSSFFPDEYFTCSSVCLSCGYVDEKCTLILIEDSAALVYSHRM